MSEKARRIRQLCQDAVGTTAGDAELEAEIDKILSKSEIPGTFSCPHVPSCDPCCNSLFIPSEPTETPAKGPTDEELANLKANMAYFSPENEENRRFSSAKYTNDKGTI